MKIKAFWNFALINSAKIEINSDGIILKICGFTAKIQNKSKTRNNSRIGENVRGKGRKENERY